MDVKRYSMVSDTRMGEAWQDLEEDPDGEWMKFEEHELCKWRELVNATAAESAAREPPKDSEAASVPAQKED